MPGITYTHSNKKFLNIVGARLTAAITNKKRLLVNSIKNTKIGFREIVFKEKLADGKNHERKQIAEQGKIVKPKTKNAEPEKKL